MRYGQIIRQQLLFVIEQARCRSVRVFSCRYGDFNLFAKGFQTSNRCGFCTVYGRCYGNVIGYGFTACPFRIRINEIYRPVQRFCRCRRWRYRYREINAERFGRTCRKRRGRKQHSCRQRVVFAVHKVVAVLVRNRIFNFRHVIRHERRFRFNR